MPTGRPNVVLILADDLGFGDLGCFGNRLVRTPRLDAMSAQGLRLRQHYSASPLCAPARASLLTGRYNHRTGAVDVPSNRGLDRLAPEERTLGDLFAACGYATGLIGKWHNGVHDLRHHPNARGFDEFVGFLNGGMDYWRWWLDRNGRPEPADGRYLTDVFTHEACAFITRHRYEPFFLLLSYNAPHAPFQAPPEMADRYRRYSELTPAVRTLYAMVEQMDAGVGRVLDTLAEMELADDTIVLFTSDNGPYMGPSELGPLRRFNGPYRGAKGDSLEGGIRVPAVLRWPGRLPAGGAVDEMIHFCDWLPTLASLARLPWESPLPLDGVDASSTLRGEAGTMPTERFWQRSRYRPVPRGNAAMRDGPWKLFWPHRAAADRKDPADSDDYTRHLTHPHTLGPVEPALPQWPIGPPAEPRLYNLDQDPGEARDLAAEQPERVARMARRWGKWFDDVLADWQAARDAIVCQGDD